MALTSDPARQKFRLLLIVRHGKAAPKSAGLSDFERSLTKTGIEGCERVLEEATGMKLSADLMLSSPADRALETAHLFARRLAYPIHKIRIAEMLYSADSIQPLVAYVRKLDNSVRTAALFGHNPLSEQLAAYFIPGFSQSMPAGSIAGIEFKAASWANAAKGRGKLAFFITPKGRKK
jgi:phosphohistidine phosphatase